MLILLQKPSIKREDGGKVIEPIFTILQAGVNIKAEKTGDGKIKIAPFQGDVSGPPALTRGPPVLTPGPGTPILSGSGPPTLTPSPAAAALGNHQVPGMDASCQLRALASLTDVTEQQPLLNLAPAISNNQASLPFLTDVSTSAQGIIITNSGQSFVAQRLDPPQIESPILNAQLPALPSQSVQHNVSQFTDGLQIIQNPVQGTISAQVTNVDNQNSTGTGTIGSVVIHQNEKSQQEIDMTAQLPMTVLAPMTPVEATPEISQETGSSVVSAENINDVNSTASTVPAASTALDDNLSNSTGDPSLHFMEINSPDGETLFGCKLCNAYFTSGQAIKQHVRKQHVETHWPCTVCDVILQRKDLLVHHMREVHGKTTGFVHGISLESSNNLSA